MNSSSLRFLIRSTKLSRIDKLAFIIIKISPSRVKRASLIKKIDIYY